MRGRVAEWPRGLGRWCCSPASTLSLAGFASRLSQLQILGYANWSVSCHLGFLTMLRLFEIFVSLVKVACPYTS